MPDQQPIVHQFLGMSPEQLQHLIAAVRPAAPQATRPKPDKTDYSGIPDFTGEPEILSQFLDRCQELIDHFFDANNVDSYTNKSILNNIRAKIKGKAAVGIFNSPLNTWDEIKTALIANFDDKRDEEHLILELGKLQQGTNENPFDFHARVYRMFTLLVAKMNNSADQYTPTTLKLMERVALRGFLMGLNEDIGRLLIIKGPTDLNDAIRILTNEYQFPNLRKKYLEKPKFPKPTQPNHQTSNKNFVKNDQNKWNKNLHKPGPSNKQEGTYKKPYVATQPQKPNTKPNTPFIPYHLRNKDTMSYQTTLNHELNPESQEYVDRENTQEEDYEQPEEDDNQDHFLEEAENYQDST